MSAFLLAFLLATAPPSPLDDPPTLLEQAQQTLEAGDASGAEAIFRRLLEVVPTWVDAHQGLAASMAEQGKSQEARRHLYQVALALLQAEALEPAAAVLEQALAFNGTTVEMAPLHSLFGRVLSRQRNYPEAVDHLRQALAVFPRAVGARELEEERARLQLYLAAALWESGAPDQAEAVLRATLSRPGVWNLPIAPTVALQLGRLLLWAGKGSDASGYLRRAAQDHPDDYSIQLDLGRALSAEVPHPDAILAFHRAAELVPEASAPHYGLARIYQFQRKNDEAQAAMERYRELYAAEQARRSEAGRQRAALDQGWVWLRNGEARAALERFTSLPESVEALVGVSAALQALGEVGKAVETLERAVELAPEREDLRLRLADLR